MSHSQFHFKIHLYLDMHGLIFETSIWLLAGSTRYLHMKISSQKIIVGNFYGFSEKNQRDTKKKKNEFSSRFLQKKKTSFLPDFSPLLFFIPFEKSFFWTKTNQKGALFPPTLSRYERSPTLFVFYTKKPSKSKPKEPKISLFSLFQNNPEG
jgi:hypothetical protein